MNTPPPVPPPLPPTAHPNLSDNFGVRLLLPVGRSGWAIAAGYLGLFALVVIPAPLALIVAVIAIIDIQRSKRAPRRKYGMGRAIFGLLAGLLGTAVLVYALLHLPSGS